LLKSTLTEVDIADMSIPSFEITSRDLKAALAKVD
jgi:hypothetical protein